MRTDIAPDYLDRLQFVDWEEYRTAYGTAALVPDQLRRLASEDQSVAFAASIELSDSLCHQHAYMMNATLPALPFILEVLDVADDRLTVEILDTLLGFARNSHTDEDVSGVYPWIIEVRERLHAEQGRLEHLAASSNPEVRDFAAFVLEVLQAPTLTSMQRWGHDGP